VARASAITRHGCLALPVSLWPMAPKTEITLTGGVRHRVEGEAGDVERAILDAARGSIMEFAWLVDAETGERVGINPAMVASLRAAGA
jgi:hypothetical protein